MAIGYETVVVARGDLQMNLAAIRYAVRDAAWEGAEEIVKTAQELAPKKSGAMAAGIEVYRVWEDQPGLWRVEIIGREPYTAAQERGSGSRADWSRYRTRTDIKIWPKRVTQLKFWWRWGPPRFFQPGKGYMVWMPFVNHPGVYGQHFMRRAVRIHTKRIWTRILDAVTRESGPAYWER